MATEDPRQALQDVVVDGMRRSQEAVVDTVPALTASRPPGSVTDRSTG